MQAHLQRISSSYSVWQLGCEWRGHSLEVVGLAAVVDGHLAALAVPKHIPKALHRHEKFSDDIILAIENVVFLSPHE